MNMMTMAMMEEAARESWEEQLAGGPRNEKHERIPFQLFESGFRAGTAWAVRQSKIKGASPAVGIKFRCIFCGKEFDNVEACNVCEESH
jgi:hypothetical protein